MDISRGSRSGGEGSLSKARVHSEFRSGIELRSTDFAYLSQSVVREKQRLVTLT